MRHPARVRKIARERLGYIQLRPGQEEAIVSVLEGRDTLVAMPAGGGKSAAYRVPALMLPGPTIVVSPAVTAPDPLNEELPILFVGASQLDAATIERLRSYRPSLFVVAEAQRIAAGTGNFLPDYLTLGSVIIALGRPLVMALTVSANPDTRMEIINRLGMRNTTIVVRGFERPNVLMQAG